MLVGLRRIISHWLASFLSKSLPGYTRLDTISIEEIAAIMEPGDILLVEGNTRISIAIKYLTQSSWSHACLYVGEPGSPSSMATLLEADLKNGVRMVSLDHYAEFNLRICRPINLDEGDRRKIIEFAKSKLGHKYDLKNVFDLVRYLIQKPPVPTHLRRSLIAFGSDEPTRAICSTLIAEAFQVINYPILPRRGDDIGHKGEVPQYYMRHFTHYTPRDFDLSPYFAVIKPTLEKGFDYRNFPWQSDRA
ncbi:MAG: YiiX/YebB-like N1pC/P60 family cysteine hydrolase [Gammaproteobacteria bacterium]